MNRSTDRAIPSRVHPQIAWATLQTLAEGARLATKQLWPHKEVTGASLPPAVRPVVSEASAGAAANEIA